MINETTFTKEWILKKSNQYVRGKKKADPTLIEKVTKALHLLEELAKTDLNLYSRVERHYCYYSIKCIDFRSILT